MSEKERLPEEMKNSRDVRAIEGKEVRGGEPSKCFFFTKV